MQAEQIEISPKSEQAWIRALLIEWGIWHNMTHNLPARARLLTGGDDIHGDAESLELTHKAVVHLRKISHVHYKLIKYLYVPVDGWLLSQKQIWEHEGMRKELFIRNKNDITRMRQWAETKIASFRQGLTADN